jgi:hypothetical protein
MSRAVTMGGMRESNFSGRGSRPKRERALPRAAIALPSAMRLPPNSLACDSQYVVRR